MSSEFTVQVIGGKEENYMKNKIKYSDEPMGKLKVIKDFLPSPNQLVFKEDNIKVTIALKKSSVEFFKNEARKNHTSYQRMIRELVDWYTSQHIEKERLIAPYSRTAECCRKTSIALNFRSAGDTVLI